MTEHFVRYWRILWFPGFSLFIGRHNTKRSIWIETRKDIFHIDIWRG